MLNATLVMPISHRSAARRRVDARHDSVGRLGAAAEDRDLMLVTGAPVRHNPLQPSV